MSALSPVKIHGKNPLQHGRYTDTKPEMRSNQIAAAAALKKHLNLTNPTIEKRLQIHKNPNGNRIRSRNIQLKTNATHAGLARNTVKMSESQGRLVMNRKKPPSERSECLRLSAARINKKIAYMRKRKPELPAADYDRFQHIKL